MTATFATRIDVDERSIAWIVGTRVKVMEIVMDQMASGWGAEEIHEQYPDLSLAQIHGAFTYYYENKELIDAQIQEDIREADRLRAEAPVSDVMKRLRALKTGL